MYGYTEWRRHVQVAGDQVPGRATAREWRFPGPLPRAEIYPTRNQGPDNARVWMRPWGGRISDTEAHRDPFRSTPPGAKRDLGTGRGRQRGVCKVTETATDACMQRREQGRAAEAGGRRVRATPRWATFHRGRRDGDRVKQKGCDEEQLHMGRQ